MKIRLLDSTSAVPFARPGSVRDVNDVLARHLIGLGQAEHVAGDPAETATVAAPETATTRPRRRRGAAPDGLFPAE